VSAGITSTTAGCAAGKTPEQCRERTMSATSLPGQINIGSIRAINNGSYSPFSWLLCRDRNTDFNFCLGPGYHVPWSRHNTLRFKTQAPPPGSTKLWICEDPLGPRTPPKGPAPDHHHLDPLTQRVPRFFDQTGALIRTPHRCPTGTQGQSYTPRRVQRDQQTTMAPFKYFIIALAPHALHGSAITWVRDCVALRCRALGHPAFHTAAFPF